MADESFHHEAFFYADMEEFVAGAASFIRDAVTAGEPVMVAVRPHQIARLRADLGDDLPGVRFEDMPTLGRNPARIIPVWRRFVADHGRDAPGLRGIGEPIWAGRGPAELVEARLHEALLNVAFGPTGSGSSGARPTAVADEDAPPTTDAPADPAPPLWLMCPYDTASLDPAVVEQARGTHPFLRQAGRGRHSHRYQRDVSQLFAEPLPAPRGAPIEMQFDGTLIRLRRTVAAWAEAADPLLDRRTVYDIVLAVEELAANSVRYGGGGGVAHLWREGDTLLCEVRDRGHITDVLAGRRQPAQHQIGGRGLWLVNQLADLVQIRTSPAGTTTRLHFRLPG